MSARASRRQVLAAIALQTDLLTPRGVAFVEADRAAGDSPRIDVDLDSIAELRAWLPFFGMTEERVSSQPFTHGSGPEKGQTTTIANAYNFNGWRGWCIHLHALDPVGQPEPALDDTTREQLAAIADSSAAHRHVAGSGGAPGQCSAECSCGVVFDGFDTIAEADALLDGHIAAANDTGTAAER